MNNYWIWFYLILSQALDGATTVIGLGFNNERELNPIVDFILHKFFYYPLWEVMSIYKILGCLLLFLYCRNNESRLNLLNITNIIFLLITFWNIIMLVK